MIQYNKLVRDKIPEILDQKGVLYEKRIANDSEFKEELIKKLLEEAEEFKGSNGDIEEFADVLEVIESLKNLSDYSDVESIKLDKKDKKGGFDGRIILKGEK